MIMESGTKMNTRVWTYAANVDPAYPVKSSRACHSTHGIHTNRLATSGLKRSCRRGGRKPPHPRSSENPPPPQKATTHPPSTNRKKDTPPPPNLDARTSPPSTPV